MQFRAKTSVDDALDVFACHGVAGIVGALLTGVFATRAVNSGGGDGLLAGNPHQVVIQLLAVAVTVVLAGTVTAVVLSLFKATASLRVSIADEIRSVDLSEHGEEAYSGGDDVGALAGRAIALGESVLIPVADVRHPGGHR